MSYPPFLFAIHNHQPVGNFASVVRAAFDDWALPEPVVALTVRAATSTRYTVRASVCTGSHGYSSYECPGNSAESNIKAFPACTFNSCKFRRTAGFCWRGN